MRLYNGSRICIKTFVFIPEKQSTWIDEYVKQLKDQVNTILEITDNTLFEALADFENSEIEIKDLPKAKVTPEEVKIRTINKAIRSNEAIDKYGIFEYEKHIEEEDLIRIGGNLNIDFGPYRIKDNKIYRPLEFKIELCPKTEKKIFYSYLEMKNGCTDIPDILWKKVKQFWFKYPDSIVEVYY